jgi:hypothetical protein
MVHETCHTEPTPECYRTYRISLDPTTLEGGFGQGGNAGGFGVKVSFKRSK